MIIFCYPYYMIQFILPTLKKNSEHGGTIATGKRKERRPINPKKSHHLVFKSSQSVFLHPQNAPFIKLLLARMSQRFKVRLFRYSINSNHLHLLTQPMNRKGMQGFLRSISGIIARKMTGAKKGKACGKGFWEQVVFSKVVEWGRQFARVQNYIQRNEWEALGVIPYQRI